MVMNLVGDNWKSCPISSTSGWDGILWRVHGMTLCEKVRNYEIRKALNVEPLLQIERS